jgi:hypothetical protein
MARSSNMKQSIRRIALAMLTGWGLTGVPAAVGQDFKVVWTPIGEVRSAGQEAAPVQRGTKVVRVDVAPAIVPLAVGKQLCLSALQVRAFGPDGGALAGAPMSIEIRFDQKVQLQLTHPKGDICMRPARAGEYPVRFTSKLLAPDSTQRGAQVFLRAS